MWQVFYWAPCGRVGNWSRLIRLSLMPFCMFCAIFFFPLVDLFSNPSTSIVHRTEWKQISLFVCLHCVHKKIESDSIVSCQRNLKNIKWDANALHIVRTHSIANKMKVRSKRDDGTECVEWRRCKTRKIITLTTSHHLVIKWRVMNTQRNRITRLCVPLTIAVIIICAFIYLSLASVRLALI